MYKVEKLDASLFPECKHCNQPIFFEQESLGGLKIRSRWTHAITGNFYCMNVDSFLRAEPSDAR
ncbi:hypothetical protein PBI_GRAYSON_259 [Rhodococcus phage Grayson]|nr:hypothetical protein PBI_GRAYSON_259 [Rhodococcus phage Grayson]